MYPESVVNQSPVNRTKGSFATSPIRNMFGFGLARIYLYTVVIDCKNKGRNLDTLRVGRRRRCIHATPSPVVGVRCYALRPSVPSAARGADTPVRVRRRGLCVVVRARVECMRKRKRNMRNAHAFIDSYKHEETRSV